MKALTSKAALALLVLSTLCSVATASSGHRPGSVLVYPDLISEDGSLTVISITNTKDDPSFNPATNLNGVVDVHFIYIDADTWTEFNRFERLTPNDTFSTLASVHTTHRVYSGFLYCIAVDPTTGEPVSHNWLIGDFAIAIAHAGWLYSTDAVPFKSLAPEGQPADLDGDGLIDLDGVEYEAAPDQLLCSSFFGMDYFSLVFGELILVSLVGSADYETQIDVTLYNDNEQQFSSTIRFRCATIHDVVTDPVFSREFLASTNTDPRSNGLGSLETGWFRLDGNRAVDVVGNEPAIEDPPFLAAWTQILVSGSAGRLLHESNEPNPTPGVLDALQ
ncbi:MAG: hypothetical protein RL885_00335 [Planctomycetota bacterium]